MEHGRMLRHLQRIVDYFRQVYFRLADIVGRPRVVRQLPDYLSRVLGVLDYVVGIGLYEAHVVLIPYGLGHAEYPGERVVYLVRYAGCRGADSGELLRLRQLELEHLLLGYVLSYADGAYYIALFVHHRREGEDNMDDLAGFRLEPDFPVPYLPDIAVRGPGAPHHLGTMPGVIVEHENIPARDLILGILQERLSLPVELDYCPARVRGDDDDPGVVEYHLRVVLRVVQLVIGLFQLFLALLELGEEPVFFLYDRTRHKKPADRQEHYEPHDPDELLHIPEELEIT